jgi:RNA polymerase sigma-70 factor, ECF subfamily
MTLTLVNRQPLAPRIHQPVSDEVLAARAASGDEQAFVQIMRANNRLLYRTARSILRDDEEAEDVLQEAYVKAYYKLASFKAQSKLSTWLVRIVINEALQRKRKLAYSPQLVVNGDAAEAVNFDEVTQQDSQSRPGPEALAMREQLSRLIQKHVERLPAVFRTVFVLRALEELTVEETASCLQIPEATVRTRYLRARGLLREHAARDIEAVLDSTFAFGGVHCDRTVARVLTRIRNMPAPTG